MLKHDKHYIQNNDTTIKQWWYKWWTAYLTTKKTTTKCLKKQWNTLWSMIWSIRKLKQLQNHENNYNNQTCKQQWQNNQDGWER